MHAPNHLVLTPKPFELLVAPPVPEIRAGHEPFLVTVDWSKNRGFWNRVELHSILDPSGRPCDVFPSPLTVHLGEDGDTPVMCNFSVKQPVTCRFSLTLHRVHPDEAFTFAAGLILRPSP
jgi:hypothetical protein